MEDALDNEGEVNLEEYMRVRERFYYWRMLQDTAKEYFCRKYHKKNERKTVRRRPDHGTHGSKRTDRENDDLEWALAAIKRRNFRSLERQLTGTF